MSITNHQRPAAAPRPARPSRSLDAKVTEILIRRMAPTVGTVGARRIAAATIADLAPYLILPDEPNPTPANLSERELQVLDGMAQGMTNGRIGAWLCLSEDTIKSHARRLYHKLQVEDRAHAVSIGHRLGLLPVSQARRQEWVR